MLDQVKSTTTARIATARPGGGISAAGPAFVARRVDPTSADNGIDHEQGHGGAPERRTVEPAALPENAIDEALAKAKVLIAPEGEAARANADNALARLLREARELNRESDRAVLAQAEPAAETAMAPETFQKASQAYSQQDVLVGRTEVLRPGSVFSATF